MYIKWRRIKPQDSKNVEKNMFYPYINKPFIIILIKKFKAQLHLISILLMKASLWLESKSLTNICKTKIILIIIYKKRWIKGLTKSYTISITAEEKIFFLTG